MNAIGQFEGTEAVIGPAAEVFEQVLQRLAEFGLPGLLDAHASTKEGSAAVKVVEIVIPIAYALRVRPLVPWTAADSPGNRWLHRPWRKYFRHSRGMRTVLTI